MELIIIGLIAVEVVIAIGTHAEEILGWLGWHRASDVEIVWIDNTDGGKKYRWKAAVAGAREWPRHNVLTLLAQEQFRAGTDVTTMGVHRAARLGPAPTKLAPNSVARGCSAMISSMASASASV